MKKHILLVCLLFAVLGCKVQDTTSDTVVLGTGLPGTWELRTQSGTIVGGLTNYPVGNGHIYVFTADTYKVYAGGSITRQGPYSLNQQLSYLTQKQENFVNFDNVTGRSLNMISVNGDVLSLSLDANDGGTTTYARIK